MNNKLSKQDRATLYDSIVEAIKTVHATNAEVEINIDYDGLNVGMLLSMLDKAKKSTGLKVRSRGDWNAWRWHLVPLPTEEELARNLAKRNLAACAAIQKEKELRAIKAERVAVAERATQMMGEGATSGEIAIACGRSLGWVAIQRRRHRERARMFWRADRCANNSLLDAILELPGDTLKPGIVAEMLVADDDSETRPKWQGR